MLRVKTWYADVAPPGSDPAVILQGQAIFITRFISALFDDMDAGTLANARSAHFHRLGEVVRFRVIGEARDFSALVVVVESRLQTARASGLISNSRSDAESDLVGGDPDYGTDVPGVLMPFTQFMEAVGRASTALLRSSGGTAVPEAVLWNWLHLLHNPMTGRERQVAELAGPVHTL